MVTGLNRALQLRTTNAIRARLGLDADTGLARLDALSMADRAALVESGGGRLGALACVVSTTVHGTATRVGPLERLQVLGIEAVARCIRGAVRRSDLLVIGPELDAGLLLVLAPGLEPVGGARMCERLQLLLGSRTIEAGLAGRGRLVAFALTDGQQAAAGAFTRPQDADLLALTQTTGGPELAAPASSLLGDVAITPTRAHPGTVGTLLAFTTGPATHEIALTPALPPSEQITRTAPPAGDQGALTRAPASGQTPRTPRPARDVGALTHGPASDAPSGTARPHRSLLALPQPRPAHAVTLTQRLADGQLVLSVRFGLAFRAPASPRDWSLAGLAREALGRASSAAARLAA